MAVLGLFDSHPESRVSSAFILRKFKKKNAVELLIEALSVETNVYAGTQMMLGINEIVGTRFHVLDFEQALQWWPTAKLNTNYHSAYAGIRAYGMRFFNPDFSAADVLKLTSTTIDREPDALLSRCVRGFYLHRVGRQAEGAADFEEVEKRAPQFRELHFYHGFSRIEMGQLDSGIQSLNRAMEISPGLMGPVRIFLPPQIVTNSALRWPLQNGAAGK